MRERFARGVFFASVLIAVCICLFLGIVHAQEGQAADGAALYEKHCAECHLTLKKTLKAGRGWQRIKSSIVWACRKNSLNDLTDDEIKAIASALAIQEE